MKPRAAAAVALHEMQQLDWPRALLAFVAACAVGRMLGDASVGLLVRAVGAVAFVTSQVSLTREFGIALAYFCAPIAGRDLSGPLACVPAAASAIVTLAFVAGAATRAPIDAIVWCTGIEASIACALIMQSARVRIGTARTAYRAAALVAASVIAAANLLMLPAAGLALSLAATYVALRGFSETLRRFDPA